MSSATLVSVDDYLKTVYDPDVDFVDGELEDRNVGEKDHAKMQLRVVRLLDSGQWFVTIETRINVAPNRYRVPDVCVYESEPDEQVFSAAPLIVVEILSPEDRMARMQRKLEDYAGMGCKHIWIVDPWRRRAYVFDGGSILEASRLYVEGKLSMDVERLFP